MRAHAITTNSRVQGRGRTTRTILVLSLAVVLVAATASTASTSPTPVATPLTLDVDELGHLTGKKLKFRATTSNDSTLVARGRQIQKTTTQLAAGEEARIKAKLKHPNRLNERLEKVPGPTVKVKLKATDEFGQTVSREVKVAVGPPA